MSSSARILAAAVLAAFSLAACGGGSHSAMPPAPAALPYTGPAPLANFAWGSAIVQGAQYAGPAKFASISVDVQLRPQNLAGLLQYANMTADPSSPLYRRFLTPQEIGRRFGASSASVAAAAAYFSKYHLGAGTWPQRLSMVVSGKQSDVEAAFGTTFGEYREFGRTFVAPLRQPHFSQALAVSGVTRLVHVNLRRSFLMRASNGQLAGMSAPQIKRAFDFTGAANAGLDGTGIDVGIIGTGPVWGGDVPAIGKMSRTAVAPVTVVPVVAQTPGPINGNTGTRVFDGNSTGLSTPPPVTAPCQDTPGVVTGTPLGSVTCNQEDGEAQLDTEQAAQLAPGSNVLFYLAYNKLDCAYAGSPPDCLGVEGIYLTDDEIQQAIADNTADAISISFGEDEVTAQNGGFFNASGSGPGPAEFAALAAEGIAVFVSSGDNGAHGCIDQSTGGPTPAFCANYPSVDPSVVAVGGVNYPMDNAGNLPPGAQITAWAQNTTAGGDGQGDNSPGSGGGVSRYFAAPAYQSGLSVPGVVLGSKRAEPDVSLLADPLTGPMLLMYANFPGAASQLGASGGTSAAAPEMSAEWAIVLQACKTTAGCATASGPHPWRLGNPAPVLYALYKDRASYGAAFYDVLAGNNGDTSAYPGPGTAYYGGYSAGTGYDLVTGLGVPFAGHLVDEIVSGHNVP